MKAAIEFQYVHKDSKQDVHHVVERLQGRDGRAPGGARAHLTGHLLEPETAALQYHEGFDLGIFERKTVAEHVQREPVDAHETGRGIVHLFAQNRPQHQAKEADPQRADGASPRADIAHEARADHHFAAGGLESLEHAGNIARVVLPVAIHANHELEAEFVGQFVPGLHAAAQTEMVRQGQHVGAGLARHGNRAVRRTIVDHQYRDSGHVLVDFADNAAYRCLLV